MRVTVYIDILFAVNLIINYFILLSVSRILRRKDSRFRILLGAFLGSVYSLFIFFPQVGFLYTVVVKILVSAILTAVAFHFSSFREYIRLTVLFYIVSFSFGGFIYALWLFVSPPGLLVRNGIVYFDIQPLILILASAACYLIIVLISRLIRRNEAAGRIYQLKIEVNGSVADMSAMLDTGNSLTDAFSGAPVIIAEYKAVEKVIPAELKGVFREGNVCDADVLEKNRWAERFLMIPFGSVGSVGGLLPAFRPDNISVRYNDTLIQASDVVIAVSKKELGDNGNYSALLNPLIFPVRAKILPKLIH